MTLKTEGSTVGTPPRFTPTLIRRALLLGTILGIALASLRGTGVSIRQLIEGLPAIVDIAAQMWPPDFSRFAAIAWAMLVTLQIAIAGTFAGLCLSLLAGVVGSQIQSPLGWLRHITKFALATVRTLPELLWALLFVVAVGPGAFAGVMAICMDTLGFAGRFFSEAMDDVECGPQDVLRVHGASRKLILAGATIPLASPSLIHTALYSLERAVRASVVLGIVGAGGIGIELKVAMDLFEYRRAGAIILCILSVVVAVEALGVTLRRQLFQGH